MTGLFLIAKRAKDQARLAKSAMWKSGKVKARSAMASMSFALRTVRRANAQAMRERSRGSNSFTIMFASTARIAMRGASLITMAAKTQAVLAKTRAGADQSSNLSMSSSWTSFWQLSRACIHGSSAQLRDAYANTMLANP